MAFSRREQALLHISTLRATMMEIYSAHACWDWGWKPNQPSGREASSVNWSEHSDAVAVELLGMGRDLARWLSLPNASRARHRVMSSGQREARETFQVANQVYDSIVRRIGRITDKCEILKAEGLPPNEATRIRQWERMLHENIERTRMIKLYRTPQALRSFGRLFTIGLPPFYAPYYAMLAHDMNSLGMAIAFAVLTAVALTALFETIAQMEDPFVSSCVLDGVQLHRDLITDLEDRLVARRSYHFPKAGPLETGFDNHPQHDEDLASQIRLFTE